jgi:hypothetical protein
MSKRSRNFGTKLSAAVLAGLVLAVVHKEHSNGGGIPVLSSVAPPPAADSAGGYSAQSWAAAFLAAIPEPQTTCNENAIVAWEAAEGGGVTNNAENDPLNTTEPEPGDWSINSVGVKAYPSYQEGLQANVTAITNGLYGNVLAALSAGNDAQAVANAVASSPWGTGAFDASC